MSDAVAARAAELRVAFDRAFSEPRRAASGDVERLLTLRLGGDPYALRLTEMSGVAAARRIVPLPGAAAELLGIAGVRGALAPVWDLGALIGYGLSSEPPRWLIETAGPDVIGLACAEIEGYFEFPRGDPGAIGSYTGERNHVGDVVRAEGISRPIIAIGSLVRAIRQRVGTAGAIKGR